MTEKELLEEISKKISRSNEINSRTMNNIIFWFWILIGWWLVAGASLLMVGSIGSIF